MNLVNQKIIFLDIDGTLVDFDMQMPRSTSLALKKAKENGHKIALCTGRSVLDIYPWLLDFGFDGIVASAGAYIENDGKLVFHHTLNNEKLKTLSEILSNHKATYMFQGKEGKYIDLHNAKRLLEFAREHGFDDETMAEGVQITKEPYAKKMLESGMYFQADIGIEEMRKIVDPYFKITGSSFGEEREFSGEITCAGIHKATGMQILMDSMDIDVKDSIAFGDGPNDVEMLSYAATGVAMGNAVEEIKPLADFVTKRINEDGIYAGFEKLGLI